MRPRKIAAIAALACGAAALATCGGDDEPDRQELATGCVIADVSGSTVKARKEYSSAFSAFALDIGTNGSGDICLIVAAGDPQAEGRPVFDYVGPTPEHRGSPDYAAGEIDAAVRRATDVVSQVLVAPNLGQGGSALIEAALVASDALDPGDRLLLLSDGLQRSPATGRFRSRDLSPAATEQLLDRLDRAGLIADLEGVEIQAPLLLHHPGGLAKLGITAEEQAAIRAFWEAWARRAKAEDFDPSPPGQ